jgi:methionine synthase II (cobalamin-independent)
MFSTLLGSLPRSDAPAKDDAATVLGELAGVGLELLATGAPPAHPDDEPSEVVGTWRAAAGVTDRPVKQVLLGPYSAGRDGPRSGPTDLAERLRATVVALADAGCAFVEIDEPEALAIAVVDGERRRFVEAHRQLVDGIQGTHLSLALTGGNLDGAGAATFFDRGYASFAFDLIAGPDNWRLIAAAPGDRGIVCGALDPRPGGDETRELLVWAAHYAASTGGRGLARVGLANAPSLADVPWEVALRKLGRVAEAARVAGIESPQEMGPLLDARTFGGRRNRPGAVRLSRPDDQP